MNDCLFDYPPTVNCLQALIGHGSYLNHNLQKAVRLWVILQSIYGDAASEKTADLGKSFSIKVWREQFFTDTTKYHCDRDKALPIHNDPNCPCAKTIADWLFDSFHNIDPQQWKTEFIKEYAVEDRQELEHLLVNGSSLNNPLIEGRLFVITGKTLENDFESLAKSGWLRTIPNPTGKRGKEYQKVSIFPDLLKVEDNVAIAPSNFIPIDEIVSLAEILGQEINGIQRFFLDLEYIVPKQLSELIEDLQQQLKECWGEPDIPPIQITYTSARLFQTQLELVVYPVCIRYHQRAPYLYAYGQAPNEDLNLSDTAPLDWYDYRLDRIDAITKLSWNDRLIPNALKQKHDKGTLPTIHDVNTEMGRALGFDFFRPKETILLRFNPYFHANYIERTERTALFKTISFEEAERFLHNTIINTREQKDLLLTILRSRSPKDIYCRVDYHVGDRTAVMRLRAWGQQVEVLSPWSLRQQIQEDITKLSEMYKI